MRFFNGDGPQPNSRFQPHGDDTVTDLKTRLRWSQNADRPNGQLVHSKAVTFCNDLTLANFNDWRLPEPHELMSLYDRSSNLHPALSPGHPFWWVKWEEAAYWTAEAPHIDHHWIHPYGVTWWCYKDVDFHGFHHSSCSTLCTEKSPWQVKRYVWCVRGN